MKLEEKAYPDQLEDLFYDTLDKQFHTSAEDGSVEEVSKLIVALYNNISNNDFNLLQNLMNAKVAKGSEASVFANKGELVLFFN